MLAAGNRSVTSVFDPFGTDRAPSLFSLLVYSHHSRQVASARVDFSLLTVTVRADFCLFIFRSYIPHGIKPACGIHGASIIIDFALTNSTSKLVLAE